ncbi:MAG TPA: hypothetical protein VFW53_04945 [Gallionella sp.]|nr:hypothetical protein [Gallionella sp.]
MQNFQAEIEVFANIPSNWIFLRDSVSATRAEKAIADLVNFSDDASLKLWNGSCQSIHIEVFESPTEFKHFAEIQNKKSQKWLPQTFARFSSTISYTKADLNYCLQPSDSSMTTDEIPQEELIAILLHTALSELQSTIFDLYLALSIAHPGAIYFWECWQFCDKRFMGIEGGAMTSFDSARKRAEELKWPEIRTLELRDVYGWLIKVAGFTDRQGTGQVGRAIAALSYLVKIKSKDENALSLVWALLGLEALYGHGNVGLKTQILEKSEALLGPRHENKKLFGWMYDFRSRLLHGDMDLLYQHNTHDADPTHEKISKELCECESLATAMLLSTLQNLCQRNSYSLEFGFTLKTK